MKLVKVTDGKLTAYCPACEIAHEVPVDASQPTSWAFNGDYENPTLSPSLLLRGYNEKREHDFVCHSFIEKGKWRFLDDYSHEMAGMVVDMQDIEVMEKDND